MIGESEDAFENDDGFVHEFEAAAVSARDRVVLTQTLGTLRHQPPRPRKNPRRLRVEHPHDSAPSSPPIIL